MKMVKLLQLSGLIVMLAFISVSYTHLRAHET